jgi:polyhydroxyalkanoate synthesis regulator phasin
MAKNRPRSQFQTSTPTQAKDESVSYEDIKATDTPEQPVDMTNEIVIEGTGTSDEASTITLTPQNVENYNTAALSATDAAADEILEAAVADGNLVKTEAKQFDADVKEAVGSNTSEGFKPAIDVEAAQANIAAVQDLLLQAGARKEPVEIPTGQVQPPAIPVDPYQLPLSASSSARLTIEELKDYIAKMSSAGRLSPDQGGQAQAHLYHTLVQAINTRAEDFEATFGLTMRLIRENLNGVFSFENMHRYTPHATLPGNKMAHFRYLLSALTALADPALRNQALRQTNMDKAFRVHGVKEDARQRVLNFFHV